jgi:hypothetical protein
MNVNDIFPSKYLKAHDLGGKSYTLTIARVTLETVGFGQQEERKLAIAFEKATKLMLLNRTNAMIIASLFGPETDMWIGKAITIYSARVKAFGTWHDALRVKEQIPAKTIQNPPPTDAMVEAPAIEDENDLLDVDDGSAHDDLWDTSAPPAPEQKDKKLSPAQLQRLNILGHDVYGKQWDALRPKLVQEVSNGSATSSKELLPQEADVLIKELEMKLREMHQQRERVAA